MVIESERPSAAIELVRSTQKQRESSRLTATNKNPRNLFGLESNELAKKRRAGTATVITLVDIFETTKMSEEHRYLTRYGGVQFLKIGLFS